ncbi:hypothetical protein C3L33_01328, partial [Rhododendron williamsianum]
MDFGEVGMDGLEGPKSSNGSGFLKKGRSGPGEEDWRGSKAAKTDDSDSQKTMLYQQGTNQLLRSNSLLSFDNGGQRENMLSFSSPRSEVTFLTKNGVAAERTGTQNPSFPYFQQTPSYAYSRNSGYGSGGLNGGINGPLGLGARGPFTPSQWVELEHQALIYKHIVSNVPVPANLLIALKKSISPYGLFGWSSGSYAPNSLGAGSFHLGFSGNTDPEPGRCRRTDGKKWRCSRDAVGDQKYCERHINRGRHRSRKPVEGRSGQSVSGTTTNVAPIVCSASSASVISSNGADNPSAGVILNRMRIPPSHSVVSPTTNLKAKDSPFSIPKQHIPIKESPHSQFGLISSDSQLNPSQITTSRNYNPVLDFNAHESHDQKPLRPFMDEWPKDQSSSATIAWPEELKSDWTQLSMSIPLASDFSSTSSSSPQDTIAQSPLRLSRELSQMENCMSLTNHHSESNQKQKNWIPISWGSSVGGPLGEVLNSTSSTVGGCKNSSASNLTRSGVWNGSPQLGSSPTGVLQKTNFVSLSNSSSGGSPRAENKTANGSGSIGDDVLGSTLSCSFSLPSL